MGCACRLQKVNLVASHIALEVGTTRVVLKSFIGKAPSFENFETVCCVCWYSLGSKVLHDYDTFDSEIHGFCNFCIRFCKQGQLSKTLTQYNIWLPFKSQFAVGFSFAVIRKVRHSLAILAFLKLHVKKRWTGANFKAAAASPAGGRQNRFNSLLLHLLILLLLLLILSLFLLLLLLPVNFQFRNCTLKLPCRVVCWVRTGLTVICRENQAVKLIFFSSFQLFHGFQPHTRLSTIKYKALRR